FLRTFDAVGVVLLQAFQLLLPPGVGFQGDHQVRLPMLYLLDQCLTVAITAQYVGVQQAEPAGGVAFGGTLDLAAKQRAVGQDPGRLIQQGQHGQRDSQPGPGGAQVQDQQVDYDQ